MPQIILARQDFAWRIKPESGLSSVNINVEALLNLQLSPFKVLKISAVLYSS
ncbi:MAG: hypothetical protein LUO94_10240 [Methylococcaceae bacterium]|nr:hypothetical protein [Methylococcaceae bacterium]